jgi:DNA replication protein DnaC
MLKNLLDRIDPARAFQGPPKPRSLWRAAPFVQRFGNCEEHGQYPLNMLHEGVECLHPDWCPACHRQAVVTDLLAGCNIPRRFAKATFDNYVCDLLDPDLLLAQRHVLSRSRDYVENFKSYRESGRGLIFCGNPGTGKNHLATAIAKGILAMGFTVLRIKAAEYLDAFWSQDFGERDVWIRKLSEVDLLILDELGRSSDSKAARDAFFRLIDARSEYQSPTLLATNLDKSGLIEVLGEAAYDRLRQGGTKRYTLRWHSYRGRETDGGSAQPVSE